MTTFNDTLTLAVAGLAEPRSKFKSTTYQRREFQDRDFLAAYEGSSLIARVIDMPAQHATAQWREWQAEDDQISAIEATEIDLDIKRTIREGFIDARLFGDGYIFMDNGEDPTTPLVPERAPPLRYVRKLDRWQISEGEYTYDPMSEYYGRPREYDLLGAQEELLNVHPSRIVHFVGKRRRQYGNVRNRFGESVLQSMYDDLRGFDAAMANIADMIMEAKVDVMKINNLMQRVTDPTELEAIQRKLELAMRTKATNGALILDMEDEEWEQKTMSFAGIPDIIDRFQIAASGAARMPRAMLFGTSAGGLGATGEMEIRNYYDIISAIQENDLQPEMRVLDAMTVKTALGSIPPEIHYNWRSLYQIDDKTKAEIGNMIVKKYVDAVGAGIFPEELAYKQIVNELTEAGVSPGLENAAEEYAGGLDLDQSEEE
jgi:hypothetical protein